MWYSVVGCFVTLTLTLLAAPLAPQAQLPEKVPRIGFLTYGGIRSCSNDGFVRGLCELGYVEGQNLRIEWRCAGYNDERARHFAGELVRLGVDVIVANFLKAAVPAKAATTTIPIVFIAGGDPVATGLVASLALPGGNVTGVSNLPGFDFFATHLELLMAAVPGVTRVALLLSAGEVNVGRITPVERAARAVGVHLHPVEVAVPDGLEAAFATMTRQDVGGLLVGFDAQLALHRAQIVELAAKSRLPVIAEGREFAAQGGLMSYGADRPAMYRRVANHVDKILKGAKPGDLPVEQPQQFQLVINLKTAKALGLTMPPSLLVRADEVIQ